MDWLTFVALIKTHAWLPLAVFVVGFLARTTQDDSKWPVNIPPQWQPVIVVGLADLYGTLMLWSDAHAKGLPFDPQTMISPALLAAFFVLVLKAFYANRTEPAWFLWLARVLLTVPQAQKAKVEADENLLEAKVEAAKAEDGKK